MKVTNNFSYYEFGPSGCNKNWVPDNDYQKMLIVNLANNLQIVRDQTNVPMKITSGVRDLANHNRLIAQNLRPSETSDHFFGLAVPIPTTSDKYKKFGSTYNLSVGAVDIVPSGIPVKDFFVLAMKCLLYSGAKFGQIIHEYSPNGISWIHFAGPYELYFSSQMIAWLNRPRFLESNDGGKTYIQTSYPKD